MSSFFWQLYGEANKTACGFFQKAGWAFVLGYSVSSMIQAFVPKGRLTPCMGGPGFKSLSLSNISGAISPSTYSFATLATARSLLLKGAHFIAFVVFVSASTNLVIELGILYLLFPGVTGWPVSLFRQHQKEQDMDGMNHSNGLTIKRVVVCIFMIILAGGLLSYSIVEGI